jgi:hypothetical protein
LTGPIAETLLGRNVAAYPPGRIHRAVLKRAKKKAPGVPGLPVTTRGESLEGSESLDAPMLSQTTARRIAETLQRSHGKSRLPATSVIALAAPKIAANKKSPRTNARPQPTPASKASTISSRRAGVISDPDLGGREAQAPDPPDQNSGPGPDFRRGATHRPVRTCHDAHG